MCTGRREVATLKKLTAADKDGRFIARLLETFVKDGRHVIVMEFVEVFHVPLYHSHGRESLWFCGNRCGFTTRMGVNRCDFVGENRCR